KRMKFARPDQVKLDLLSYGIRPETLCDHRGAADALAADREKDIADLHICLCSRPILRYPHDDQAARLTGCGLQRIGHKDGPKRHPEPPSLNPALGQQRLDNASDRGAWNNQDNPARAQCRDAEETTARVQHRSSFFPAADGDIDGDPPVDSAT